MTNADYVLGLDVGGTEMKAALVDRDGQVQNLVRRPTPRSEGPDAIVEAMCKLATEFRPQGIAGIVVPGVVDRETGTAVLSANLGWRDLPIKSLLEEHLHVPVALGHDVTAAATMEVRFRASKGIRNFLYIAIGSGIGGAVVMNGEVYRGEHEKAGEVGHIAIRNGGLPCGCGNRGCLETLGSASSIAKRYAEVAGVTDVTAKDVAHRVREGDEIARWIWFEAIDAIADALVIYTSVFDPEVVVIGGGLSLAKDILFLPLRAAIKARTTFQTIPRLLPAYFPESAGCSAAGLMAWSALDAVTPIRNSAGS